MSTVMCYGVATDPVTLEASPVTGDLTKVSMTVVVSNPTGSAVMLESLTVALPIGDSGTDLTADWKDIRLVPADKWKLDETKTSAGHVQYVLYPDSGHGSVGSEGLAFVLQSVEVNRQPGTFKLVVTEGSGGCDPSSNCPEYCKLISKFPNGWGEVAFWVDPANMPYGGQVYLHWDGPAAAPPDAVTYEIEYTDQQTQKIVKIPAQNQPALPAKGQYPPKTGSGIVLQQSTEFTLNVSARFTGENYQTQLQKLVTVAKPAPTITSFSAGWEAAGLKIAWKTEHADHVELSLLHGEQERNDSISFQPSPHTPLRRSFTLTATNDAGSVTSTLVQQGYEEVPGSPVLVGSSPLSVAVSPDAARVFIANLKGNNVTVLDAETLTPAGNSPFPVGKMPTSVAVSSDGARVYVSNYWDSSLTVYNAAGFQEVMRWVGKPNYAVPPEVAISPDNTRVFLTQGTDHGGLLTVLNAHDLHESDHSPVNFMGEAYCIALAVSPVGLCVFVGSDWHSLSVLDARTLEHVKGSPVGLRGVENYTSPKSIAVSPDGRSVFLGNTKSNRLSVFKDLQEIEGSPFAVGPEPPWSDDWSWPVAVSLDGKSVLVAMDNKLAILDAQTLRPEAGSPIPVGAKPSSIALSPDGARIYVANHEGDSVTVLRPAAFVPAQSG